MSLDLNPDNWLHVPLVPNTGADQNFSDWDVEATLRTIVTAVQRLGGRKKRLNTSRIPVRFHQ